MNRKKLFIYLFTHWFQSSGVLRRSFYLLTILTFTGCGIYLQVYLTKWHNDFIQSLTDYSYVDFIYQLKIFFPIVFVFLLVNAIQNYLIAHLGFEWRKFTVDYFQTMWLSDANYYRLTQKVSGVDNPDQRITQDIVTVTANSLQLILLFLEKITSFVVFSYILWDYSKVLTIQWSNESYQIPGLLFWMALLYCMFGTLFAFMVGKKIVPLTIQQEKKEANFRYYLMRVFENAQAIAMSRGQGFEGSTLKTAFSSIEQNFYQLLREVIKLDWYTGLYSNVSSFVPMLMVGPFYFLKMITLGTLMQINRIFAHVYESLSQVVFNYKEILRTIAALTRLHVFYEKMIVASLSRKPHLADYIEFKGVVLNRDVDRIIKELPDMTFKRGSKILIRGTSGCGKSTMMRALAGLHPHFTGEITAPESSIYIPSMLYLPIGSLSSILDYPSGHATIEQKTEVLDLIQLSNLQEHLESDVFDERLLSMGEKQRVILSRLLFPVDAQWILLDEPTSHLNDALALHMMKLLLETHSGSGFVVISHDAYPCEWFDEVIDLG